MAKEKNKAEGQDLSFLAVISHQLKSPLHSIESLLKVITEGFTGEVSPQATSLLQRALAKTEEARQMLEDLFHLEKYSQQGLQNEELELSSILKEVFHRFQVQALEKNLIYSLKLQTDTAVIITGDREALDLAINNLIENAIKYTPTNGQVQVELNLKQKEKKALILVRDSGPGITDEEAPSIFKAFYRSSRLKNQVPGTGLGLALAQRVIQAHGGEISFQGVAPRGTEFCISLDYLSLSLQEVKPRPKVVIVGGVTSGPKAAARLRRLSEELDITIIEKSEFLSYAGCGVPAYICGKVSSPKALMSTSDSTLRDIHFFEHIKDIHIRPQTEVLRIDRKQKKLSVRNLPSGNEEELAYDVLILATGARSVTPLIPGLEGSQVLSLYRFEDAERIKQFLVQKPAAEVFIIGGGLVGIETAEALLSRGARVTVFEKDSQILKQFDAEIAHKIAELLRLKGIKVLTNVTIQEVKESSQRLILLTDCGEFQGDLIILSAGVKPNAELGAQAGLDLGPGGGILVDEYLRTSDPAIYAIGDCCETKNILARNSFHLPLGSVSTKMGRIAADNIAGFKSAFKGSLSTVLFRIFEIEVGRCGLTYTEAQQQGYEPESIIVSGLDHSHYLGDAREVIIKMLADRRTHQILGVQGYGRGSLASRIGIAAVALSAQLTLDDLFKVDLGYYPAFNNPIDILQTACLVLENKLNGILDTISIQELEEQRSRLTLIDVSPELDYSFQAIPGSINIPLENLRSSQLPFRKDEELVLYSRTSSRAYESFRYLKAQGFTRARVLEGGYLFYRKGW